MRRRIALLLAALPLILMLGWAAAGVALAGGGCHPTRGAVPSEGNATIVKIDGCTFAPTVTRVPIGTEVRFLNSSPQIHDVTGRNGEWGSDTLQDGQSFAMRFAAPGIYPYSCSLHPGMAGVVVVGSPVAAAAPAADAAPAAADIAPVAVTTPAAPASADGSPLAYLATGGIGLVAGLGVGAAAVARRRRPA